MDFSFGIISSFETSNYLERIILSIRNLNIPNYEIIIVGEKLEKFSSDDVKIINFNDDRPHPWITKKKNLITKEAKFENIVYLHDYIYFDKEWYSEFLKFGDNFEICINPIMNKDGTRYRDWCIYYRNNTRFDQFFSTSKECLIPYNEKSLTKYMYISGAYWIGKKKVMEDYPLDEKRFWGDGEDVEWSFRVRKHFNFKINKNSLVKMLKYQDPVWIDIKDHNLQSFKIYVGSNEEKIDKIKFLIKRNLNTLFRILKINKHFSIVDIKAK